MGGWMVAGRYVIMLDGGFVKRKLEQSTGHFPTVGDVLALCTQVKQEPRLQDEELFRIYYYDAPPYTGKPAINPIDKSKITFSTHPTAKANQALIDSLELQEDFAVRRGEIIVKGWKLGTAALRTLKKATPAQKKTTISAKALVPDMEQKGVDLRVGLDMATIALKRVVDTAVLVTGDSDFVPAMKLARTEGLKVYLKTMGHPVRRELKAHADYLLP